MSASWVRLAGEDHDETIDAFELTAARRALALIKGKLGRERLLELLRDEIAAGGAYMSDNVARSAGQELAGTTTLRAHGISAPEFVGWLGQAFAREDVMIAGHPEHYSIHAGGGPVNIVETLGEHVCSFFMRPWDAAADGPDAPDDGAVARRRSHMLLEDGTVIGSIANAYHHESEGFSVRLTVTLPASCGQYVVDHHLEHFAVEYRSWIRGAIRDLAAP